MRAGVLIALLAGLLAACGVKGDPVVPEGAEASYRLGERQYPAPHTVVPQAPAPDEREAQP